MNDLNRKAYKEIQKDYDIIPPPAVVASRVIADMWIKLGQPQTPFTNTGKKMMDIIIAVWEDLYPLQSKIWWDERKNYQANEMTISEQVSQGTGRSLASYPLPIYNLMKKVFRGFDATERNNCIKIVKQWPQFRMANKV